MFEWRQYSRGIVEANELVVELGTYELRAWSKPKLAISNMIYMQIYEKGTDHFYTNSNKLSTSAQSDIISIMSCSFHARRNKFDVCLNSTIQNIFWWKRVFVKGFFVDDLWFDVPEEEGF